MMKKQIINNVIGIDTVSLSTDNFEVTDINNSQLVIVPLPVSSNGEELYSNVLWIDSTNTPVFGKSAYYNSTGLNLNLVPRKCHAPNVKVKYTPGNIIYQNNYETVNVGELRRATDQAQAQIIRDTGIRLTLDTAKITRLDIQVTMEFKESLAPLFDVLTQFKEVGRLKQKYDIGQSICWSNTQKALCIYNKTKEFGDYTLASGYRNALRIEYRLMKHQAIKHNLGITNISQLTQAKVNKALLGFIKPIIERLKPKLCLTAKGTLQQTFDIYKENNADAKLREYIYDLGVCSLLKSHGINEMTEVVKENASSDSTYKRMIKKVKAVDQELSTCKNIKVKTNLFYTLEANLFGGKGKISGIAGTLLCT